MELVKEQIWDQVHELVNGPVSNVHKLVNGPVSNQVSNQIWDQLSDQLSNRLWCGITEKIGETN